jgi:hypothetical protein
LASFFENDLLWYIPTVAREMKGLGPGELICYFFNPLPLYWAVPSLKIYTYFVLNSFGFLARYFIFVSLFFHFACSVLLFLLAKRLGLGSRVAFFSTLTFLTLFAHFHAYMWPTAFQHLIVVFFILLTLNLYLKTAKLVENKKDYHLAYFLTLVSSLIASICRASILILPLMIMSHILFCAKDDQTRVKRFDLWLPLFLVYLIYPLITISFGDTRLFIMLAKIGAPVLSKFLILLSLGLFGLVLIRRIGALNLNGRALKRIKILSLGMLGFLAALLIIIGGVKRLLIPYNFLLPFSSTLNSFFHPIASALSMDSTRPHYYIAFGNDLFIFTFGVLIILSFIKEFFNRDRSFIILGVWYTVALGYLYIRNPLASRYFIYISPVFSIVFCSVFIYFYSRVTEALKVRRITKEIILILIFIIFCIPNLFAIKLALFKGRQVNTFMTYDYIRSAQLIKEDLMRAEDTDKQEKKEIYVDNIVPVKFTRWEGFSVSDTYDDNARYIFTQVFGSLSKGIRLNQAPESKDRDSLVYYLDGFVLRNPKGVVEDNFARLFNSGLEHLRLGHLRQAIDSFEAAATERPFLLKFVLGDLSLDSLQCVANGQDMRSWINKITSFYNQDLSSYEPLSSAEEIKRINYVSQIMRKEIDEYVQCLFYLSYLENADANIGRSRYWFSQIRFLESDFESLFSGLSQVPLINSDKRMLSFLKTKNNVSLSAKVDDYVNRFKIEKLIINLF